MSIEKLSFKRNPIRIVHGKKVFIPNNEYDIIHDDLHSDFINRFKIFLRKFPRLYAFVFYFIAPAIFLGKEPKYIYNFLPKNSIVLDIGSGNRRLCPEIINIDLYPWSEVDVIADAHNLPFSDSSIDGVVFSWVLEHMKDPEIIASEIYRILKKGGYLYLSTNFITPYHSSPNDYYRWTDDGLRVLFKNFKIIELKPHVGPTCAFLSVFQEWLSLVLSFNVGIIKDIVWILLVIITSPLKLLDLIFIHYSSAKKITAGFYLIARKK